MSLISQTPLDYGIFYGTNPGISVTLGSSNVNYSGTPAISYANRQTEFAQKSGNNINILKNGKYQVFIKFRIYTTWNYGGSGSRIFRVSLNKNLSILKELNYAKFSNVWTSQINQFEQELIWPIKDDATYSTTATGTFLTDNGVSAVNINSVFSNNDFYELNSGDVISLNYSVIAGQSISFWITNIETIIKEVKY
jgi:hypothetical protein